MNVAKVAYSLLLTPIVWLLLGAPSLEFAGNLALVSVVALHLNAVIWTGSFFSLLGGDRVTYGGYTLGATILSFAINFVIVWIVLRWHGGEVRAAAEISPYAWGLMGLSALSTVAMPLLTHRNVEPLPKLSERRDFENPCDDREP